MANKRLLRVAWWIGVAVVAVVALGCTRSPSTAEPAPASASLGTGSDDASRVASAYRNALDVFEASLMSPSDGSDRLAAWWAGPALAATTGEVNAWAGFGHALRLPEPTLRAIEVVSVTVEGEEASLRACVVDDGQTVDVATGSVLDAQVTTTLEDVTLQRNPSGWVVTKRARVRQSDGVTSCDA